MEFSKILREVRFLGIVLAAYSLVGFLIIYFIDVARVEHIIQLGIVVILVIYIIRIIFNIMHQLK